MSIRVAFLTVLLAPAALYAQEVILEETSCTVCHQDSDLFEEEQLTIVHRFTTDVHSELGLSCHDCHGGNAALELADDPFAAMDDAFTDNPYVGVPQRAEIPGFCGRCHSDPEYMKRYKPDARVDQEREYWTSGHGRAMAAGDTNAATCTDCHGNHDIQRPVATESKIYPANVAETCRTCHEDAAKMAGYTLADGRAMPTDQYALWRRSVHAASMYEKEDLSAPTCNDCHGNHGATPPGLDSVAFVCGQCHGREARLFRNSAKHQAFIDHNEYLAEAEGESCAGCHDTDEVGLENFTSFGECTTCHGNHGVVRPTVAMFSNLPNTPCAFCHENPDSLPDEQLLEPESTRESYSEALSTLLKTPEAEALQGEALFDYLVDRAVEMPNHIVAGTAESEDGPALRPEFENLFAKFRIGKSYYTYDEPSTGDPVRVDIVRCNDCHLEDPEDEESGGTATGISMVGHMHELTTRTAQAERILLAARRGGVETREALTHIDQAIGAQIGLEVLVHGFSTEPESEFIEQFETGREHAEAAVEAGHEALGELQVRRRGLAVALGLIVLVLLGLGMKIRSLSAAGDA